MYKLPVISGATRRPLQSRPAPSAHRSVVGAQEIPAALLRKLDLAKTPQEFDEAWDQIRELAISGAIGDQAYRQALAARRRPSLVSGTQAYSSPRELGEIGADPSSSSKGKGKKMATTKKKTNKKKSPAKKKALKKKKKPTSAKKKTLKRPARKKPTKKKARVSGKKMTKKKKPAKRKPAKRKTPKKRPAKKKARVSGKKKAPAKRKPSKKRGLKRKPAKRKASKKSRVSGAPKKAKKAPKKTGSKKRPSKKRSSSKKPQVQFVSLNMKTAVGVVIKDGASYYLKQFPRRAGKNPSKATVLEDYATKKSTWNRKQA